LLWNRGSFEEVKESSVAPPLALVADTRASPNLTIKNKK